MLWNKIHGAGGLVGGGGALWTPTNSAANVVGWWDASDTSTITVSASAVTQWDDKSSTGANLTQSNATYQPVDGSTINSLNAINFNNDYMYCTNPYGAVINDFFFIALYKMTTVQNSCLFNAGIDNSTTTRFAAYPWGDGTIYWDAGSFSAPERLVASSGVSAGNTVLISFRNSPTDSLQDVYKNGALLNSDSSAASDTGGSNFVLGAATTTATTNTVNNVFGEVILVEDTVSASEQDKFEGYLAHKWGVEGNLPSGHAYKTSPPSV